MRRSAPLSDMRTIKLHGPQDFAGMRRAGHLAAATLDFITPHVRAGVTTDELDRLCERFIRDHGAIPAPLNYRGFPKSICTSVNHVVCHGIPNPRKELQEGDIINIDVTVILDGWHGDTSRMFTVGRVGVKAQRLIDITFEAMWEGIRACSPGSDGRRHRPCHPAVFGSERFSVVRDFCGHGFGRIFHDAPQYPAFRASRATGRSCARACSSPSSR